MKTILSTIINQRCDILETMDDLPTEIIVEILAHVLNDRLWLAVPLKSVCRRWHGIIVGHWLNSTSGEDENNGRVSLLKRAVCNEIDMGFFPFDKRLFCARIAGCGYLDLLGWARDQGCPWDKLTSTCAAKGGHLATLKWLKEQGCPWNEETCSYAALNGHLDVLKWMRERACPWNSQTCSFAALRGHLELLKWAIRQGCPWDHNVCLLLSEVFNFENMTNWLMSQNP